ncbi:hypothetical protein F7725_019354 [Dissostichus mawsoni]|uniref:Uncharacterized protein n=1 Tax=Dissostichus mawsoni TaxID=36200 RepID=A0A7J5YJK2_DISMA|nr:hypothetical protein F7725_019354 [Dissostichus mawsoni]
MPLMTVLQTMSLTKQGESYKELRTIQSLLGCAMPRCFCFDRAMYDNSDASIACRFQRKKRINRDRKRKVMKTGGEESTRGVGVVLDRLGHSPGNTPPPS